MTILNHDSKDDDFVFPGENWFLYWKTSASLWKVKLEELKSSEYIVVPLNWSLHSETGERYDFAQGRPETDLKKIVEICSQLGKKVVFFLPLTPAPFLSNGGMPHLLARSTSLNHEKMVYSIIDVKGGINKLYSFFDPRVYQSYRLFILALREYLIRENITVDIWGINCFYLHQGAFHNYMEDSSKVFEKGFARFLKARQEGEFPAGDGGGKQIDSLAKEQFLKNEFFSVIKSLYLETARENLAEYWEGELDISFLGGGIPDLIERITETGSNIGYSAGLFSSVCNDFLPASVLLSPKEKKGILAFQFDELIRDSLVPLKIFSSSYDESNIYLFSPLYFFEINVDQSSNESSWGELGLFAFLKENYRWEYKLRQLDERLSDSDLDRLDKIYFFEGKAVDSVMLNLILKIFMRGGKIILNRSGLSRDLSRRLETFFLENSLEIEKVNINIVIQDASLGEGRMICFDGDDLKRPSKWKKGAVWHKLIKTFDLVHLHLPQIEGVDYFWRTRCSSPSELNYGEVRRLSIYNQTSYKKKFKFNMASNCALMKIFEKQNASIRFLSNEVELEFLPNGSLIIDFGIYH